MLSRDEAVTPLAMIKPISAFPFSTSSFVGITRADSYSVRIVPAKSFTPNVERETQFYISIDGKKAKINPDNAGGSFAEGRKYPGTETDILIKQIQ